MKNTITVLFVAAMMALSLSGMAEPQRIKGTIRSVGSAWRMPGQYMTIFGSDKKCYYIQPLGVEECHLPKSVDRKAYADFGKAMMRWSDLLYNTSVVVTELSKSPYVALTGTSETAPIYRGVITFDRSSAATNGKKTFHEAAISLGYGRVCEEDQKYPKFQTLSKLEEEARKARAGMWSICVTDALVEEADEARREDLKWATKRYEKTHEDKQKKQNR